jgi:hypothetical protein
VDQLEARTGVVTTAHGGLISVRQALQIAAEADIVPVVVGDASGVLGYGLSRRTASIGQRRALAARDGGCSFPGCDRPPDWCETHHVIAWADGGRTDIENLTLLCGFHHREHHKRGWSCHMSNGIPHWRPPRWIDPNAIQLAEGWGWGCGLTISRGCSLVVGELFVRQRGNDRRKNVPCL